MCGIVGIACNNAATLPMKELFLNMLLMDVVRGEHATGIATIDTHNREIEIAKKAMSSPAFLVTGQHEEIMAFRKNFNIMIGHNRFATRGDKTKDEFAHPFHHGDIVGCHNGSLHNQSLLDDHKDFEVDSENIIHHINLNGIDDTLQKLNGSFSLVWYNSAEDTLNFIRNDDRPLAIARVTGGHYIWASEIGMLRWLVRRHKTISFDQVETDEDPKVKEDFCYQLTPGMLYRIPFKGRQIQKPVLIKKTLPKFETPINDYYLGKPYGNYQDYRQSNSGSSRSAAVTHVRKTAMSNLSERITEGKIVELRLIKIVEEPYYNPSTQSQSIRRRFLFKHRLFPGDKVSELVFLNLGYDMFFNSVGIEDLGKTFFGTVTNSYYANSQTQPKEAVNPTDGHDFGVVCQIANMSREKPEKVAYMSYCHMEVVKTKKELGDESKPPFPVSQSAGTLKLQRDNGKLSIALHNCKVSSADLRMVFSWNAGRCANCAKEIVAQSVDKLYMITEKEECGDICHWLMCSHQCYQEMKTFAIDAKSLVIEGFYQEGDKK